jgi:hypothetical protein
MQEAWAEVKRHPRVTVTIDLYDLGLVFLRQEQAPSISACSTEFLAAFRGQASSTFQPCVPKPVTAPP